MYSETLLSRNFKPSRESRNPAGQCAHTLQYLRKVSAALEKALEKEEEVPLWVQSKIQESAVSLGMALSYVSRRKEKA